MKTNRNLLKKQLKENKFDVLVIGGGITGAGIALDASTRGMKTALVEMQDFSAGTSSRSTKLVHGGLRYLKQFEVKMVAEVGKERAVVYENGPHVTTPEWMLLPFHTGGTFGKFTTSIGLRVYDFLAGVKKKERRKMFSKEQTLAYEPLVKQDGLKGGGYYVEYRTDDSRLTIEVMKEAIDKGAAALNYTKVENLLYDTEGKINGVAVTDVLTGEKYSVFAEVIVNAAGPWVDSIREKDGSRKGKTLQLTKGVHLVIDQSVFPLKQAIYFDTPDGRMVFAIPRDGKAYVGTTDTFYKEDPVNPAMTVEDRTYILNAIKYMFPSVNVTEDDVESSWAGVRPLILEDGKDPSEISRKDEIWESESGLVTIAGGKLTGYRKMAETVVNLVSGKFAKANKSFSECQTKHLPISGGKVGGSSKFDSYVAGIVPDGMDAGLTKEDAEAVARMYGSNAPVVYRIVKEQKASAENNMPVLLWAKVHYALEHELAMTPVDVLLRRTGLLLFGIKEAVQYKEEVLAYMASYYGWDQAEQLFYKKQLEKEILHATVPADLQSEELLDHIM
ncbi:MULTISPECIES: glycerol-3-phosphate dehydrogenase/oxidase [Bacillaceae]|uniref:glycerol-3-phosphate dehydrogenase/oxidase n=1 Tax=Bacillaceae TaxID=186817 RepID=UPI001E4BDF21|nr:MULTISPECIES: glycerol-3-phosphate dehydrogenase/oxidase [Bacillaceae]MCE4047374.1 glycerol-3-phosphate dehydrogenase/oxidase [Bacillus sp. Au-Bac7]MDL0435934.1 glycerol-3-phosphate dehydrogenase/oxidase [Niallia sp. SS-2023]UPO86269.1 glycerol-3-phosphate dehydrogenase/oxidase [Niallia sp. Man26]